MSRRTGEEQVCNYTLVLGCICIGMTEQEQCEGVEENKKRLGGGQGKGSNSEWNPKADCFQPKGSNSRTNPKEDT